MKDRRNSVARCILGIACTVLMGMSLCASAGYSYDFGDGLKVDVGADMRIRLTAWDRETLSPEMQVYGGQQDNGPAWQYLRVRTRVWGSLQLDEGIKLNARLVNRSHHYFSRPGDNNTGPDTWQFPDEVIFDRLNLQLTNLMDGKLALTLGRQDVILGNGMIFLEGTPYDQGRTIYFDGASAVFKTEADCLTVFAFYSDQKDKAAFIDDQNRRLRQGDIFTTGAYWTHNWTQCVNTDLYYIYADVEDERETMAEFDRIERNWPWSAVPNADMDAVVHTAGLRVFGPLHEQVDYSVEYAREFGEYDDDADLTGSMFDARLTLKAPPETLFTPSVMFEYVYFSGDDMDSGDEMEGWIPLFAAYPIWREEILPIMFNGNWTNMHQYRVEGRFCLSECLSARVMYSLVRADYGDLPNAAGGGSGDTIGHLVSAFLDYKMTDWASFALEASEFMPNSYWNDGDNATWLRFQTVLRY